MLTPAALFLIAASGAIETPVVEGLDIVQTLHHYTVTAVESRALSEQMEALGPDDPKWDGRSFGYTLGEVGVSINYVETGGGECKLTDTAVRLDVKITLPDWQPSAEPSRRLEVQWQAFYAALTGHELQHRENLITGARNVRSTLVNLPAMPCGEVEARVNAATAPIVDAMNEANRAYDARTEHGRTEGAWWLIW